MTNEANQYLTQPNAEERSCPKCGAGAEEPCDTRCPTRQGPLSGQRMLDEVARRMGVEPRRARIVREVAAREEAEQLAAEDTEAEHIEQQRQEFERDEERAALAAIAGGAF